MTHTPHSSHFVMRLYSMTLAFACSTSWAQDGKYRPDIDLPDCLFKEVSSMGPQEEALRKRACYEPAMIYARTALDRAETELVANGIAQSAIDDIQKKWEAFVEQNCIFQTAMPTPNSSFGKTISVREACYLKHISARANELMWIKILYIPVRQTE